MDVVERERFFSVCWFSFLPNNVAKCILSSVSMVAIKSWEESPLTAAFNLSDLCVLCFMRTINSSSLDS